MTLNHAAIFALLLVLAACAQPQPTYEWRHSQHGDRGRFDHDVSDCRYEAVKATAGYSSGPTARSSGGSIAQGLADGFAISARQSEVAVMCMKARGYTQHSLGEPR